MKRFMSLLLTLTAAVIVSLAFTGCNGQGEKPAGTEHPTGAQPSKVEQPAGTEHPTGEQPSEVEQPAGTEHPTGEHPK